MNTLIKVIPFIELLLVVAMLGLSSLGYLSLWSKTDQLGRNQYGSIGKWILPSLVGLALLAIILLCMISFGQE